MSSESANDPGNTGNLCDGKHIQARFTQRHGRLASTAIARPCGPYGVPPTASRVVLWICFYRYLDNSCWQQGFLLHLLEYPYRRRRCDGPCSVGRCLLAWPAKDITMEQVQWRINLFGRLTVEYGECRVSHFKTNKTGLLLACLAHEPRRQCRREELVEQLWPGEESPQGRNNLRVSLAFLRHALEPHAQDHGALVTDRC